MASTQDNTSSQGLLDQQRALAAFGEVALGADDLSALLTEACRLVGQALDTDLAKVVELTADGKTMLVRAGVGWKPGVVNEVLVSATENTPEGLTLKDAQSGGALLLSRVPEGSRRPGVRERADPERKGSPSLWCPPGRQPFTSGVSSVRHRVSTYLREPPRGCPQPLSYHR